MQPTGQAIVQVFSIIVQLGSIMEPYWWGSLMNIGGLKTRGQLHGENKAILDLPRETLVVSAMQLLILINDIYLFFNRLYLKPIQ
jgi:hypothetical protein